MLGLEILLKENKVDREDLANKLGINKNNISIWFKKGKVPTKHLSKLAKILKADEVYLNSDIENKNLNDLVENIKEDKGKVVSKKKTKALEERIHILEQDKALLQITINQLNDTIESLRYSQDADFIDKLKEQFDKTLITLSKENRSLNTTICSLRKENNSLRRENIILHKAIDNRIK